MKQFDYQTNLRLDRFMYLFSSRGDKLTSDAVFSYAGDYQVHRITHAKFGKCVGITGLTNNPVVFSEKPIPADYPRRTKSAA